MKLPFHQQRLQKKLYKAILADDVVAIRHALNEGADINGVVTRSHGLNSPPLCEALRWCKPQAARYLIDSGADVNLGTVKPYYSPLYLAISNRVDELFEVLVEKGAALDVACDRKKQTLLHVAARRGSEQCVRRLLELGADPAARDLDTLLPADIAGDKMYAHIVKLIGDFQAARNAPTVPQGWKLLGAHEVALTTEKPAIDYRLTEIFNFERRAVTLIAANLKTGIESLAVRNFCDLEAQDAVDAAARALVSLGGSDQSGALAKPMLKRRNGEP